MFATFKNIYILCLLNITSFINKIISISDTIYGRNLIKILLNIYKNIYIFYLKIMKFIFIKMFEILPNKLFKSNKDNDFIKSVVFTYDDCVIDVTNKFKWIYNDKLSFSDLQNIYTMMAPKPILSEKQFQAYFITFEVKDSVIMLNIYDNSYYTIEDNFTEKNDIIFDTIPINLLK